MFISFEGIDGCGKSTQLELLAEALREDGREVLCLREPGATKLSEAVREILLSVHQEIVPVSELLLFSAARAQLVENVIRPALAEGKIVLSDRYVDSTSAYQGYGREISLEKISQINEIATGGLKPHITFFFDIPVDYARKRSESRESRDRMEQAEDGFFERVKKGYLELARAEPERIVPVDALQDVATIHNFLTGIVREKLFQIDKKRILV